MAYDTKALTRQWITFLKNKQIASSQSDPKTGKLNYKRSPTADDLAKFLQLKTDFDDQVIGTAIRDALANRPANKAGTPAEKQPEQTPPAAEPATEPAGKGGLSQTPDAIRKREQRAAASQAGKAGASAFGQMASQLSKGGEPAETEPTDERKPKLHTKLKTPGTATQKPRVTYRGLKEDISDISAEEIDEPTVEQIFNSLAFHAPDDEGEAPPEEPEDQVDPAVQKQEEMKKIKRLVRDSMAEPQIKSLWRELKDDSNITESLISRGDVNAIFKQATDIRSKPSGLGRVFKGLRKDSIDINDLQQAWKDAGFPDDTQDIMHILQDQGFGDKEIKKVFSSVFGDSEDEEGYADPETSPAVLKIAEYIKKKGMADEIVAFLEREYGQMLGTEKKPGLMSRIKKKFTTEDIRHIFTQIVKEERSNRTNLIRAQEQTHLGRKKK